MVPWETTKWMSSTSNCLDWNLRISLNQSEIFGNAWKRLQSELIWIHLLRIHCEIKLTVSPGQKNKPWCYMVSNWTFNNFMNPNYDWFQMCGLGFGGHSRSAKNFFVLIFSKGNGRISEIWFWREWTSQWKLWRSNTRRRHGRSLATKTNLCKKVRILSNLDRPTTDWCHHSTIILSVYPVFEPLSAKKNSIWRSWKFKHISSENLYH